MVRQVEDPPVVEEQRIAMTYDEYLAWYDLGDRHGEWVDGEVIVFVPPTERHQDLLGLLFVLLSWYARRLDLGKVILAPFEMRIRGGRSSREPNIVFVAREHADRLDGRRLEGAADLAVEIVSDDSTARDRRDKLAEYGAAGIPEYWIFDPRSRRSPRRERAEFYRLGDAERYEPAPLGADGRYDSHVLPGFWLDPEWLWRDPLPDPDELKAVIAPAAWRATVRAAGGAGWADGA